MATQHPKSAAPALPSHLAAACIFARPSYRGALAVPPPCGVLAELASLQSLRRD